MSELRECPLEVKYDLMDRRFPGSFTVEPARIEDFIKFTDGLIYMDEEKASLCVRPVRFMAESMLAYLKSLFSTESRLRAELTALKDSLHSQEFKLMYTSDGKITVVDVSELAKKMDAKSLEIANENIDLWGENRKLRAENERLRFMPGMLIEAEKAFNERVLEYGYDDPGVNYLKGKMDVLTSLAAGKEGEDEHA